MNPLLHLRTYLAQAAQLRQAVPLNSFDLLCFLPAWHCALAPDRSPLADQQPWMTFATIRFLNRVLTKQMRVFEYGAGGSTLFFARHAGEVTTVEHDPNWGHQVLSALGREEADHAELYFLPPEAPEAEALAAVGAPLAHPEPHRYAVASAARGGCLQAVQTVAPPAPAAPVRYDSSVPNYRGLFFRQYVCHIESWPDGYFDLVSVDGRARPACLKHAQPKVKPGGWLLLNNAERPHYQRALQEVRRAGWVETDLSGPGPYASFFWQAKVWQKPLNT